MIMICCDCRALLWTYLWNAQQTQDMIWCNERLYYSRQSAVWTSRCCACLFPHPCTWTGASSPCRRLLLSYLILARFSLFPFTGLTAAYFVNVSIHSIALSYFWSSKRFINIMSSWYARWRPLVVKLFWPGRCFFLLVCSAIHCLTSSNLIDWSTSFASSRVCFNEPNPAESLYILEINNLA